MTITYHGNIVDIKFDTTDRSGKKHKVSPSDQFK